MVLCYACHGKDLLWFSWFEYLLFYQISWPLPFYFSFFFRLSLSLYGFLVGSYVGSLSYIELNLFDEDFFDEENFFEEEEDRILKGLPQFTPLGMLKTLDEMSSRDKN